jgi:IS30 family transposase
VPSLVHWIEKQIQYEWSPDQIAGFMSRVGSIKVSRQWIYHLIYRDRLAGGSLWTYCRLPHQRRYQRHLAKRAGLGKIPGRVGIEHRPKAVDERLHIGHWEGDTILHGHKNSGAVTLVERRTGYLLADCVPKLKAGLVTDVIIRELRPIRGAVQTLTLDNGSEFAGHQTFSKTLSLTSYFCDPYRSSQRGSNENTNGLLRQYFPKGTDFARVSRKAIRQAVNRLNNRPRKRLGYRTPAEVFWGEYSGALNTRGAALIT